MLHRNIYCTLIVVSPRYSLATYFDSGSLIKKKDYTRIRGVLDDALEGYASKGCSFANKTAECILNGKHVFKHVTEFPCVKQPARSVKDAFYVLHHLWGFVRDCQMLTLPCSLRGWAERLAQIDDDNLREDFFRIQTQISKIIQHDVMQTEGTLHYSRGLPKREVEERLQMQADIRTWTTKDGYKPFPPPSQGS